MSLVTSVSFLELPFLVRTASFHLENGSLIFRLGRSQQLDAHYWEFGGSYKFVTTLPHTEED